MGAHEQGLSIAVFDIEEVAVGVLGHGHQETDDMRQQVDPLAIDRDTDVEREPVDAAALVQDGIEIPIGRRQGRGKPGLYLDPPSFLAQARCHLHEEPQPRQGGHPPARTNPPWASEGKP